MAGFRETISILLQVDEKGAVGGIKSFRQSVVDADGVTGKFKAVVGGAFQYAKDHATEMALAGGAALVAFAVKAVNAFEDTAKAAVNLAAATGLSTEQASRWIAVGDDFQVTADQLTSGIGRIAKTLNDSKWAEYGIQTRDAAGNVRSANDVLVDTLSMLSKVKNETERARIGNDLFGKGFAGLAPLLGHTAAEYRNMLGSVEKGQVVTAAEAEKAERMRLAQDALADAIHEVTLQFGEWAAEAAPAIEVLAKGIGVLADFRDGVKDVVTWMAKSNIDTPEATGYLRGYRDAAQDAADAADELATATEGIGHEIVPVGTKTADLSEKTRDYSAAATEAEQAIIDLDTAYRTLKGHLDDREAWRNVTESLDALKKTVGNGEASWRDLEAASDDAVQSVADYINGLDGIDPEVRTRLLTELDQGEFNAVLLQLNSLREDINVKVKVSGPGSIGYEKRASGGPAGGLTLVGERGPELVDLPSGSYVHDAVSTSQMLAPSGSQAAIGSPQIVIQTNWDERRLVQTLRRYQRRGGQL